MSDQRRPSDEQRRVGERLRVIRLRQGLKSTRVADRLDMTEGNYLLYEAGRNKLRADQIRPFADALGVDAREFFEEIHPIEEEIARFRPAIGAPQGIGRGLIGAASA